LLARLPAHAELLQKGKEVFQKFGLVRKNGELGRFVKYTEDPHLERWADIVLGSKKNERGVFVGGKNTRLGTPQDKWFDNSINKAKEILRSQGLEEIRKIKLRRG
jgi:hypothetical protein